ncbi:MAG: glutathione binding-like protein [Pseudomonadota bacterium]
MKLHFFPGSCALAPHIVLARMGVDYEAVKVVKGDPAFQAVNPLGVVPAIEHDGRVYTQADAILHWLADREPEAGLGAGHDVEAHFQLNHWMAFLTGDLHPAFFPFFNPVRYTVSDDDAALADVRAAAQVRVAHYLDFFEAHMKGREFLVGGAFSIADAYAVPMLRWVRLLDRKLDQWPSLDAYLARLQAEPAVLQALREQGLKP